MTTRPPLPRHLFTVVWIGSQTLPHDESCSECMRIARKMRAAANQYNMRKAGFGGIKHGAQVRRVERTDSLRGLLVG